MDYEKKYNDALKKAKSIYRDAKEAGCSHTDWLEHIFPQLAESEDERIRKGLIEALKISKTVGELKLILPEPIKEECLAYLEKQKPIQTEEEREYVKTLKGLVSDFVRDCGGGITDVGYYQRISDWLDGTHIEQKSVELSEEYSSPECGTTTGVWSEEDEKMRLEAIKVLESGCERYIKESGCLPSWHIVITWLKSLRPQPKQEWDEEDEHRRKDAIYFLESAKRHYADTREIEKSIDWLKSLHPQPHWKPSKEQIGALNYAYCELFKREDVGHNILGQLQKLLDDLMNL